jgi:hypothetical protein
LVYPDRSGVADILANTFEHIGYSRAAPVEPSLDRRRVTRERIDHGEYPSLATVKELVMDKVHRPHVVSAGRFLPILPELCLDLPLWRFVPQLQAHFAIEAVHQLDVDRPALSPQQNMDTTIAVAHTRLGDLLDSGPQCCPVRTPDLVVVT